MFRFIFAMTMTLAMSFLSLAYANIGTVTLLKGQAEVERKEGKVPLHQNDEILEFDVIHTAASSFIKITMNDDTIIQLGPEGSFKFTQNTNANGLRQAVFELIKGKLRTAVHKKAKDGESLKFGTNTVSLGVRGTEFLTNVYMVENKLTTDVLLLKGKLAADATQLGIPVKSFDVTEGQYFNTHQIIKDQGLQSIKTLSSEAVKKMLENSDALLPELMDAKGLLQDLGSALSSTLGGTGAGIGVGVGAGVGLLAGAAVGALGAHSSDDNEATPPAQGTPTQAPTALAKETVTIIYKDKEAPDPADIREAKEKRAKMHKFNQCHFWFYKVIPGAFTPERFRRERDCDEYQFDL